MEKLFTTREAADFLHVSLRTFKYWTSANKIAPVQSFRSANCTRATRAKHSDRVEAKKRSDSHEKSIRRDD